MTDTAAGTQAYPLSEDGRPAEAAKWQRARDLALELVQTLPIDAKPAAVEALAAKLRANAVSHPDGAEIALSASGQLAEALVRRQVYAKRAWFISGRQIDNGVISSMVAHVRRVRDDTTGRTLFFSFEGGQRRAARARDSFIDPQNMPPEFEAEEGWFLLEHVSSKPWAFWRGTRQVAAPEDDR